MAAGAGYPRRMRRLGPLLAVALVALAFLGTVAFLWDRSRERPEVVETTAPQTRDIVRKTVATGAIVPRTEVDIKPRVSGVVAQLEVEPGDVVSEGDLIASIRVVPDSGRLAQAESRVEAARLSLTDAQRELERAERLSEEQAISDAELDRSRSTFSQRQQELEAARVDLQIVRDGASRRSGAGGSTRSFSTTCDSPFRKSSGGDLGRSSPTRRTRSRASRSSSAAPSTCSSPTDASTFASGKAGGRASEGFRSSACSATQGSSSRRSSKTSTSTMARRQSARAARCGGAG